MVYVAMERASLELGSLDNRGSSMGNHSIFCSGDALDWFCQAGFANLQTITGDRVQIWASNWNLLVVY